MNNKVYQIEGKYKTYIGINCLSFIPVINFVIFILLGVSYLTIYKGKLIHNKRYVNRLKKAIDDDRLLTLSERTEKLKMSKNTLSLELDNIEVTYNVNVRLNKYTEVNKNLYYTYIRKMRNTLFAISKAEELHTYRSDLISLRNYINQTTSLS